MIGLLTIVLFKAKERTIPLNYYANFSLILMKLGMEVKNGEQSFYAQSKVVGAGISPNMPSQPRQPK